MHIVTKLALFIALGLNQSAIAGGVEEIASIENNLLPTIRIEGEQYQATSILARMKALKVPGVSIAVIKDGKLHWAKGYGIANKASNAKVTSQTLFQAGSISKPIAALGALKLVKEGKLSLDNNVNDYLTSWQLPHYKQVSAQPVTLRQLLTHTSGLTVHGFPGYNSSEKLPTNIEVLTGEGNTDSVIVDTEPGKNWRYSGGGYTVMEQLVEDVAKQDFSSYMQNAVLKPLGMENTTYEQPLPKTMWPLASAAFDGKGEQIDGNWHNYPEQAAAGLWTTPSDIAKYIIAVQHAKQGKQSSRLSSNIVEQMLTPHKNSWGLGPQLSKRDAGGVFQHGGKNAGFTNHFSGYIDQGDGIVVMTNADNGGAIISELRVAISSFYNWDFAKPTYLKPKPLSTLVYKQVEGKYTYDEDSTYAVTISRKEGKFEIYDHTRESTLEFISTDDAVIRGLDNGTKVSFELSEQGELSHLMWSGTYKFNKVQ